MRGVEFEVLGLGLPLEPLIYGTVKLFIPRIGRHIVSLTVTLIIYDIPYCNPLVSLIVVFFLRTESQGPTLPQGP